MKAAERRERIMSILSTERRAIMRNLAARFECDIRTIRRDIDELSVSGFPVVCFLGRYGGGVQLADWYQPHCSRLTPEQIEVLRRLASSASPKDRTVLTSILDQFSPKK